MENDIIIIIGKQGCGKTTLVETLIENKKTVCLNPNESNSHFFFSKVNADTEIIVMEEVFDIDFIRKLVDSKTIIVNKKYFRPFGIKRPKIIITSNYLKENHFPEHLKIKIIKIIK